MILLGALLLLAACSIFIVWYGMRFRRPRLAGAARKRILKQWEHARTLPDPGRRVVEADIVLDHALKELGYTGPLGEKLKRMGARFPHIDDVWNAHRLRNRISHEPGVQVSEAEADRALRAFERAVRELS